MIREIRLSTNMDLTPEILEIMVRFSVLTRLAEFVPDISIESYDHLGDRSLNLVHKACL